MAPNTQGKLTFKGSPLRKEVRAKLMPKANKSPQLVLEAFGFPPTGVEAYSYTRVIHGVQQVEAYINPFRQFIEGTTDNNIIKEILEKGNFMACYYQRINSHVNERKMGSDNCPRYWMIRNLERGQASSKA